MIQNESTLRPTPLSLHCDCDRQTCNGEVVEISTACAKEIYIRCDSASVCPPNSPPRQQAQKFYCCLPRILERAGAEMAHVVLERVFFRDLAADHDAFTEIRRDAYRQGGVPEDRLPLVSYVEQPPALRGRRLNFRPTPWCLDRRHWPACRPSRPAATVRWPKWSR